MWGQAIHLRKPWRVALVIFLATASLLLSRAAGASAQSATSFLAQAVPLAHDVQRATGVPSSVILAQAILETGWGRQPVAAANNYFGIKASPRPDGTVNYGTIATGWMWASTKEWNGTQYVDSQERFRAYQTMADSFHDLGQLYTGTARYAPAMQAVENPREFATRIAQAGFATDPNYAARLIQLMDTSNLYQYDLKQDDAEFLDQSDYPTVAPGQVIQIYFEVKNSGYATWSQGDHYYLVNENNSLVGPQLEYAIQDSVAPEATIHWAIQLVAPKQPGAYRTEWRLYHGDTAFGPEMYIDINVAEPGITLDRLMLMLSLVAVLLGLVAGGLHVLRSRAQARTVS